MSSEPNYKLFELTGLPVSYFETNRKNFFSNLEKLFPEMEKDSLILLQSGDEIPRNDTDVIHYHFQQESNFYYLTGVTETNFHAILDIKNKSLSLFYERDNSDVINIFMNLPRFEELEEKYKTKVFDKKLLLEEIRKRDPKKIYFLSGVNSDSGLSIKKVEVDNSMKFLEERFDINGLVYEILAETRTVKTKEEMDYLQFICSATIEAHQAAIRNIKPGKYERDIESDFMNYLRTNNYARSLSYQNICGCGPNSKTLHYQNNDNLLKEGDLILMDMGIRLGGYCSDVTSTVPVNGKFTERQKAIYDIVLKSNLDVIANLKPGVKWPDMHLLAESVILKGLTDLNILNNSFSLEQMLEDRVAYYFMPHGLGHFMGLEVHDVGGYLSFNPMRSEKIGLSSLRTSRTLEKGNCITVEPGIYFIPFLLERGLANEKIKKYLNEEELRKYFEFGGVRIEDDVLITENGCVNMTGKLPRRTEDIEKLMKC